MASPGSIVVVTGARALWRANGGTEASESWAREVVVAHVGLRSAGVDCVYHGDCVDSPDKAADEHAKEQGIHRLAWNLDGFLYYDGERRTQWGDRTGIPPKRWPLVRNAAMAKRAKAARDRGLSIYGVAVCAPWAKTHGTLNTATLLESAGIEVQKIECPVELGPAAGVPAHHCHARGCSVPVPPEMLMCARHWRLVPKEVQREVWRHYRDGQCDDKQPSEAWHRAADAAIAVVAMFDPPKGR